MKSKFFCMFLVAIMVLQLGVVFPVFANETQESTSYIVDFTDDDVASPGKPGFRSGCVVKGQYGKAADDASYRFYSIGGTNEDVAISNNGTKSLVALTINNQNTATATTGKFYHLGFQFLNEDNLSTLGAAISYVSANDGSSQNGVAIMSEPRDGSNKVRVQNLNNGGNYRLDYTKLVFGTWVQVDFYFNPDSSGKTTMMINGNKKEVPKYNDHTVSKINSITFTHTATVTNESTWRPTGAQIDNVVFEVVDSVPESHTNYRHTGESFNFDENGMTISGGKYMLPYYYSSAWKSGAHGVGVAFGTADAQTQVNSLASRKFGKYSWDKSLHTLISDSSADDVSAMDYTPSVKDFKTGENAHLTFAVANGSANYGVGLSAIDAQAGSDGLVSDDLFEMSSDGNFKFFDIDTDTQWQKDKWYKIDIIFNVSTVTMVDCYIDGTPYITNMLCSNGSLSSIGTLSFTDTHGSDYYVDDVAFGITDVDPADGWKLTSNDFDISDGIDNTARVITVAGNYRAEDFLSKIDNPEQITLYNSNGAIVYSGLLTSCLIKVSNTFGAGIFYTVESTGIMTEATLFDIADGSVIVADSVDTLNISSEDDSVIRTDVYIDGKLLESADYYETSIDLSSVMLGKHKFEAYAYVNDKDCYIDSVNLTLIEEIGSTLIASGENNFETYTGGSYAMTGGKVVEQAYAGLAEKTSDSSGKNYGTSLVFEAKKELASQGHSYVDIFAEESKRITKTLVEFDICILSNRASVNVSCRNSGVSDLTLASNDTTKMELNKWYHIKYMVDIKNKLMSVWVDDVPLRENAAISPSVDQLKDDNDIRLQVIYADRTSMSIDSLKLLAIDNITMTKYDELAYVKSVEDSEGNSPLDYTSDVLTVNMSCPVEEITADSIKLYSTNGVRPVKSVEIDDEDASILYITPKYTLNSADTYTLVIDSGMKSSGNFSSRENCGFFETAAKDFDVVGGSFTEVDGDMRFTAKMNNQTSGDQWTTLIVYMYDGDEFKGIASQTMLVKAGKSASAFVNLPYYSPTAKAYALVVDGWDTMKPVSNKLYSFSY